MSYSREAVIGAIRSEGDMYPSRRAMHALMAAMEESPRNEHMADALEQLAEELSQAARQTSERDDANDDAEDLDEAEQKEALEGAAYRAGWAAAQEEEAKRWVQLAGAVRNGYTRPRRRQVDDQNFGFVEIPRT